jgi:hypothetical protein
MTQPPITVSSPVFPAKQAPGRFTISMPPDGTLVGVTKRDAPFEEVAVNVLHADTKPPWKDRWFRIIEAGETIPADEFDQYVGSYIAADDGPIRHLLAVIDVGAIE